MGTESRGQVGQLIASPRVESLTQCAKMTGASRKIDIVKQLSCESYLFSMFSTYTSELNPIPNVNSTSMSSFLRLTRFYRDD